MIKYFKFLAAGAIDDNEEMDVAHLTALYLSLSLSIIKVMIVFIVFTLSCIKKL